jgi:hypothetical protein
MAFTDGELAEFLIEYGKTSNMLQVADEAAKRFGLSVDDILRTIKILEWKDSIRPRADPARNVAESRFREGATRGWWERGDGSYSVYSEEPSPERSSLT